MTSWGLDSPWSPDGRRAAFLAQFSGTVVDLESGSSTDLADVLRLGMRPRREILGRARWTETGELMVQVVESPDEPPPVRSWITHTYAIDAATGRVRDAGSVRETARR
jgi:hypothetical protein